MIPVVIKPSRRSRAQWWAAFLVMGGVGLWGVAGGGFPVAGWILIASALAGILFFVVSAPANMPNIIIGDDGLNLIFPAIGVIPWEYISSARATTGQLRHGNTELHIELNPSAHPDELKKRFPAIKTFLRNDSEIVFVGEGYEINSDELAREIMMGLGRFRRLSEREGGGRE